MPDLWYGEGAIDGSMYPGLSIESGWHMVLSAWTAGRVEFQFERMKSSQHTFPTPDGSLACISPRPDFIALELDKCSGCVMYVIYNTLARARAEVVSDV